MQRPNILIVIADGMQADTIQPEHPCITPHLEHLQQRGVTFANAHTTCPTCSPARASMMTGLLPHNHGVLEVEHGRDDDQSVLRTEYPHFAQQLQSAGYRTGYFGKWHIERTNGVENFGWEHSAVKGVAHVKGLGRGDRGPQSFVLDEELCGYVEGPPGYNRILHWGVTHTPLWERYPGLTCLDAEAYIDEASRSDEPWCCCVSFSEPNEALVVGHETWERYDADEISLPENFFDDMSDRPNFYQREQLIGKNLTGSHWRAARACYFGRITEVDTIVGRLVDKLEATGQRENTVVIFLADHGRYVGAHGFDAHNFGAFEEIYRIPMVVSGPQVAESQTSQAQVSIADLAPTICDVAGAAWFDHPDSYSFSELLTNPELVLPEFSYGFAEYHGTRFGLTQRILWDGAWKFVFNGFDFDELYNLEDDPHEMANLIHAPEHQEHVRKMMSQIWKKIRETGDRTLLETHYFSMRFGAVGPEVES